MRNNAFSKACTSIIDYQNLTRVHVHTWIWGWLASILAPGFLDRACLLFVCPITGPLFMCNAADILCRIFSVLNSGPIPTKYNNAMSSFSYIKKKFAEYSHLHVKIIYILNCIRISQESVGGAESPRSVLSVSANHYYSS